MQTTRLVAGIHRTAHWRAVQLLFGLAGGLLVPEPGLAQHGTGLVDITTDAPHWPPELKAMPLTVRPSALRLATTTARTGVITLDTLRKTYVYVPTHCAGTVRCPLALVLHGAGGTGYEQMDIWRERADQFGLILLAPTSASSWQLETEAADHANLDSVLTRVLTEFAIDTAKIMMGGFSASGGAAVAFAGQRPDLFSRLVLGSTDFSIDNFDPKNTRMRIYLSCALSEAKDCFQELLALRARGQPVDYGIELRQHAGGEKSQDAIGQWLQEGWRSGGPRLEPAMNFDSLPLLTTDILRRMAAFWRAFLQEPESIRTDARAASVRPVLVPLAAERVPVGMADMTVLAARFPSVAADLKAAGLTAQQHDLYRVALVGARMAHYMIEGSGASGRPTFDPGDMAAAFAQALDSLYAFEAAEPVPLVIEPASRQGRNLQFARDDRAELTESFKMMWVTP